MNGEDVDYFRNVKSINSLSLKNYNYAPYEEDESNVERKIIKLFGDNFYNTVSIGSLSIKHSDTIPARFTENVNSALETVTIQNLNTTEIGDYAFKDCTKLKEFNSSAKFIKVPAVELMC